MKYYFLFLKYTFWILYIKWDQFWENFPGEWEKSAWKIMEFFSWNLVSTLFKLPSWQNAQFSNLVYEECILGSWPTPLPKKSQLCAWECYLARKSRDDFYGRFKNVSATRKKKQILSIHWVQMFKILLGILNDLLIMAAMGRLKNEATKMKNAWVSIRVALFQQL